MSRVSNQPLGTLRGIHILLHPVLITHRDTSTRRTVPTAEWIYQSTAHLLDASFLQGGRQRASGVTADEHQALLMDTFTNNTATIDLQYMPDPARLLNTSISSVTGSGQLAVPALFVESNFVALVAPNPNPEKKQPIASFGFDSLTKLVSSVNSEFERANFQKPFRPNLTTDTSVDAISQLMADYSDPSVLEMDALGTCQIDYVLDQKSIDMTVKFSSGRLFWSSNMWSDNTIPSTITTNFSSWLSTMLPRAKTTVQPMHEIVFFCQVIGACSATALSNGGVDRSRRSALERLQKAFVEGEGDTFPNGVSNIALGWAASQYLSATSQMMRWHSTQSESPIENIYFDFMQQPRSGPTPSGGVAQKGEGYSFTFGRTNIETTLVAHLEPKHRLDYKDSLWANKHWSLWPKTGVCWASILDPSVVIPTTQPSPLHELLGAGTFGVAMSAPWRFSTQVFPTDSTLDDTHPRKLAVCYAISSTVQIIKQITKMNPKMFKSFISHIPLRRIVVEFTTDVVTNIGEVVGGGAVLEFDMMVSDNTSAKWMLDYVELLTTIKRLMTVETNSVPLVASIRRICSAIGRRAHKKSSGQRNTAVGHKEWNIAVDSKLANALINVNIVCEIQVATKMSSSFLDVVRETSMGVFVNTARFVPSKVYTREKTKGGLFGTNVVRSTKCTVIFGRRRKPTPLSRGTRKSVGGPFHVPPPPKADAGSATKLQQQKPQPRMQAHREGFDQRRAAANPVGNAFVGNGGLSSKRAILGYSPYNDDEDGEDEEYEDTDSLTTLYVFDSENTSTTNHILGSISLPTITDEEIPEALLDIGQPISDENPLHHTDTDDSTRAPIPYATFSFDIDNLQKGNVTPVFCDHVHNSIISCIMPLMSNGNLATMVTRTSAELVNTVRMLDSAASVANDGRRAPHSKINVSIDKMTTDHVATTLSLRDVVQCVKDVCSGLLFLNHLGINHGDVKPANVFVDCIKRAHIGDLGSARPYGSRVAQPGTPIYQPVDNFAPLPKDGKRVILGDSISVDSYYDIYAVGVSISHIRRHFSNLGYMDNPLYFELLGVWCGVCSPAEAAVHSKRIGLDIIPGSIAALCAVVDGGGTAEQKPISGKMAAWTISCLYAIELYLLNLGMKDLSYYMGRTLKAGDITNEEMQGVKSIANDSKYFDRLDERHKVANKAYSRLKIAEIALKFIMEVISVEQQR